jgi:ABC-type multidrug transport system ATPase subunit
MENSLKIKDVTFKFKSSSRNILNDLNYNYISGDIVGIYGINGSGKTTLLNCLSGFYTPTTGEILINGNKPDNQRSSIAIIPADIDLIDYLTIEDNVKFFMEFYGLNIEHGNYNALLIKYGLKNHASKYVFEASKGMLRKTQIVISILMKPKILLADEPLDGLDEHSKEIFFEDMNELSTQHSTIILYSLHDEKLLNANCNKIIKL